MHAAIHPLTPGDPVYGLAKIGAVGSVIALKVALTRRGRGEAEVEQPDSEPQRRPHPVSARKARRRRKRRRPG